MALIMALISKDETGQGCLPCTRRGKMVSGLAGIAIAETARKGAEL